jgi:hypothetical protein
MSDRQLQLDMLRDGVARPTDLVMRYPPNWTAVIFFAVLSCLHLINGLGAFWKGKIEGELSAILGILFAVATAVALRLRNELAVRPSAGDLHLRTSLGRIWFERHIPFASVRSVRLFLGGKTRLCESRIEILCDGESIECPSTRVPRQEALYLAMAMDVELIKICEGDEMSGTAGPTTA